MYASARDVGVPASRLLRSVSTEHRTPGSAIWTCAGLAIVVTLYGDAFSVPSAGSAVFLFISYAMPIGSGLLAEGHAETPWRGHWWTLRAMAFSSMRSQTSKIKRPPRVLGHDEAQAARSTGRQRGCFHDDSLAFADLPGPRWRAHLSARW